MITFGQGETYHIRYEPSWHDCFWIQHATDIGRRCGWISYKELKRRNVI